MSINGRNEAIAKAIRTDLRPLMIKERPVVQIRVINQKKGIALICCQAFCASRMHHIDKVCSTRAECHFYLLEKKKSVTNRDRIVKKKTYSHTVEKKAHEAQDQTRRSIDIFVD